MISREVLTKALTIGMCFFEQTLSFLQDCILGTSTLSKGLKKNPSFRYFCLYPGFLYLYPMRSCICIFCSCSCILGSCIRYLYYWSLNPYSYFWISTSNLGFCICFPGSCFCSCIFGSRIFTIDYWIRILGFCICFLGSLMLYQ